MGADLGAGLNQTADVSGAVSGAADLSGGLTGSLTASDGIVAMGTATVKTAVGVGASAAADATTSASVDGGLHVAGSDVSLEATQDIVADAAIDESAALSDELTAAGELSAH